VRVRDSSLAYGVAAELRTAIMDGAFNLGEPLSEDTLSDIFGVSRTPVREALRQLQAEGLVDVVPKSGTYIFKPSSEEIFELGDYRLKLETWAVELAIATNPDAAATDLEKLLADMTAALDADDRREYNRLDARFHSTFFNHCGNRYLQQAYRMNVARISALRAHLASRTAGATATSMDEHALILDRFRSGDAQGVASVLEAHILRTRESYSAALRNREAVESGSKRDRLMQKLGR
jgi:DNA-binding GntR family transcriptional regulator